MIREGGLLFPQLGQGGEEGKLIEAILLGNQVFWNKAMSKRKAWTGSTAGSEPRI